jgi:hypothetical protein
LIHAILLIVMLVGSVSVWLDRQPLIVIQASSSYARHVEHDVAAATVTVVLDDYEQAPTNIQQQIQESVAATEQLSEAERIEALDKAAERLTRISSETSIDGVAKRLQSWLNLTPRVEQPVAENSQIEVDPADPDADEDEFDFNTAQLHDVKRVVVPNARPRYLCVLLDAHGRTLEVPLSEAEGEPIYALMVKIKSHPLLERIYRQIAMPLLDQMVAAKRVAREAVARVETDVTDAGEDERDVPSVVPSTEQ